MTIKDVPNQDVVADLKERDKIIDAMDGFLEIIEASFVNSKSVQMKHTGYLLHGFVKLAEAEMLTYGHYGNLTIILQRYRDELKKSIER